METRCSQSEVFSHNFKCTKNVKDVILGQNQSMTPSYSVIQLYIEINIASAQGILLY